MKDAPYIDVIRQIMLDNKLSQQNIADMLGVNQTTVSQWLLGNKKPGYDNIAKFYTVFGVEPNDFFDLK